MTASGSWSASDGLASASASLTGAPVILMTAQGSAAAGGYAYADSSISYFVTVNASSGFTDLVPIHFVANLAASATANQPGLGYDGAPYGLADAAFSLGGNLYTTGPNSFESRSCTGSCLWGNFASGQYLGGYGDPTLSQAISGTAWLGPGDTGVVTETVWIQVGVGGYFTGDTANAWASADPYFFIDPDFALEHPDISLTFSSGVENNPLGGGGVPEPSAWALMILGFGGAGALLRRRPGLASPLR